MGRLSCCKYQSMAQGDSMVITLFRMFSFVALASETGVLGFGLKRLFLGHRYGTHGGKNTSEHHSIFRSCGKYANGTHILGFWIHCACLPNYVGIPPNCRAECDVNVDCPDYKACIKGKCEDPCHSGTCAANANCRVMSHSPYCTCLDGYSGDPYEECVPTSASSESEASRELDTMPPPDYGRRGSEPISRVYRSNPEPRLPRAVYPKSVTEDLSDSPTLDSAPAEPRPHNFRRAISYSPNQRMGRSAKFDADQTSRDVVDVVDVDENGRSGTDFDYDSDDELSVNTTLLAINVSGADSETTENDKQESTIAISTTDASSGPSTIITEL